MRFLVGFATGMTAAWVALAIWQRVPEFPELEPDGDPDVTSGLTRRGDRRPDYNASVASTTNSR